MKIFVVMLQEAEEWSADVAGAFTTEAAAEAEAAERNKGYGYWYVVETEVKGTPVKISIPRDRFFETSVHRLTSELSDLGLRAFPTCFDIPGVGNGNAFIAEQVSRDIEGDIFAVRYGQVCGCVTVTIYND